MHQVWEVCSVAFKVIDIGNFVLRYTRKVETWLTFIINVDRICMALL